MAVSPLAGKLPPKSLLIDPAALERAYYANKQKLPKELEGQQRQAMDKLQKTMKVVPQEVLYVPKFTYIWTLAETRFPEEMKKKISREEAVRELARCYLSMCGMTLLGDLSRAFGFYRWESGRANHQLVDEKFAERSATGVYHLAALRMRGQATSP